MPYYLLLVLLSVSFLFGVPSAAQADSYTFTTINFPGSPDTRAFKINNEGQLVGWYLSSGFQHGFLYEAGSFTPLDVPFPGAHGTVAVIAQLGSNKEPTGESAFWIA